MGVEIAGRLLKCYALRDLSMYKYGIFLFIFFSISASATDITCPSIKKIDGKIESVSKIVDETESKIHFFIAVPESIAEFSLTSIFVITNINDHSQSVSLPVKWYTEKNKAIFKLISGTHVQEFQVRLEYSLCGPYYDFRVKA